MVSIKKIFTNSNQLVSRIIDFSAQKREFCICKCRQLIIIIALLIFCSLYAFDANAATINAASCSQADVTTAYNSASAGDTVAVPAGDCTWTSSYLTSTKANVIFQGAGAGSTFIRIAAGGSHGFQMQANGWRITGFTFDCNYANTSNAGPIRVGSLAGNPTWEYGNWRIDHNTFDECGASGGNVTGYDAISLFGFIYGVIDHNTFNDCNGECIGWCSDGQTSVTRSTAPGGYTNGTVFIEDNTWNHNRSGILYENILDGNSGNRSVIRHNTINVSDGAIAASGIASTHETCARCSGVIPQGDAGSLVHEMYENTINLNNTGRMRDLLACRGGKCIVYNNHITFTGSSTNRYDVGMWLSNYRSTGNAYPACAGNGVAASAANGRGYSDYAHLTEAGYTSEGLDANMTTLHGAINASATSLTLTSSSGFNANGVANGFAVIIDSEVIYYTGVSGNQLTGLTRGANNTTAALHSSGAGVGYLKFGVSLEQPNNTYIWGNEINGVVTSPMNDVYVCGAGDCLVAGTDIDYTHEDIKSYTERPNNWQYQTGTAFSYTPYTYPHPLVSGTPNPSPPLNLQVQ